MKRKSVLFIVLDLLLLIILITPYLSIYNINYFFIRNTLYSQKIEYILYTFINENIVNQVVENNYSIEKLDNSINLENIYVETDLGNYLSNEYEDIILSRDLNNEDYKVIKINIGNVDGYMVVVYNPSKIILMTSEGFNKNGNFSLERISSMTKRYEVVVGIPAGGFDDVTLTNKPKGCVIQNQNILWNVFGKVNIIGFDQNNELVLLHTTCSDAVSKGIKNAVTFEPFLIKNGEIVKDMSVKGGFNRASRVAIAQRKDGIVLFLVTNGNYRNGPLYSDIANFLLQYGAYNASCLDGGASSQLVINQKLMTEAVNVYGQKVVGGRKVINGWGLKL